jgi:hypothetical protein
MIAKLESETCKNQNYFSLCIYPIMANDTVKKLILTALKKVSI